MAAAACVHVTIPRQTFIVFVAVIARRFIALTHDEIGAEAFRAAGAVGPRAIVVSLASLVALHRVRTFAVDAAARRALEAEVAGVCRHFQSV